MALSEMQPAANDGAMKDASVHDQGVVYHRPTRFQAMSQARCARILHDQSLGRVGFVDDQGIPQIYPLTYRYRNGRIYFLAAGGSKLAQATSGRRVAFEVDGWNPTNGTGWSVLVSGMCTLADAVEAQAAAETGLRPWLQGDFPMQWVRIVPERISGRLLGSALPTPTGVGTET
jgi:nitroimidazol reductase NimA-like FMN-containing flavoprotein (pyridoxamine 5'-phosphate oxidase superfamily)